MKSSEQLKNKGSMVEESLYLWKNRPKVFKPKKSLDPDKPTAVDFFCGLGGLSLGFEMADFQVALGLDYLKPAIHTFRNSHPEATAILGDIRKIIKIDKETGKISNRDNLITKTLESVLGNKKVDVVMGGIPCQGFSLSNKKRCLHDERNYLFIYFLEIAKLIDPNYVLIENVSGLKSMGNGMFVEEIEGGLREIGCRIVNHRMLNSSHYGVPQVRNRIIFIGAKGDHPIIWPTRKFGTKNHPIRTVGDAISDLPPLEASESVSDYLKTDIDNLTEYQKIMRGECKILTNHETPNHPESTIEKIKNTKPGEPMYPRFKQRIRLSWDKPSPTQVSGGIRPQFQFGHPDQARGLTVRERCRIQSIPDRIKVYGGVVQGRVQTGNAVPPLLAFEIAKMMRIGLTTPIMQSSLMKWHETNKREFPWREKETNPYHVLISEMLLRKTRAENIVNVYNDFIKKYPEPAVLACADLNEIEELLRPLGLSRIRAEALKKLGQDILTKRLGAIPNDENDLMKISHVGRYIANATVCFGYNKKKPIVDENVQRILNRMYDIDISKEIHKADYLWNICESIIPDESFKEFCWSMLDFAAKVCTSRKAKCEVCPQTSICSYHQKSPIKN